MICYFDTSALVKLYVEEDGSELTAAYSSSRKGSFVVASVPKTFKRLNCMRKF
jgi:predicted nucleic acid-binding protein